jgi:hypothetical protein
MNEQRRVAVIAVCHDGSPLTGLEDVKALFLASPDSVANFWRGNTEDWFEFTAFDFFGPYGITLPPPPDARATVIDRARSAAQQFGVDLSGYDSLVVVNRPGFVDGKGYDHGANGIGPGHACAVGSADAHSFYCHEFGHVLGFDHSYGLMNSGADWSDDGVAQQYEVYGDPYDLMSSASFGGADPTTTLSMTFAGFSAASSAGPMLARAQLHFARPLALERTGKVRHVYEDGDVGIFPLYPAGNGEDGKCELVVFHPRDEDAGARGRVYVEYRQPFGTSPGTRWDQGLAEKDKARDRRGVVVHVVKDAPGTSIPVVWYAGRVCFPSPDADVAVSTPQGTAVVTVSGEQMPSRAPTYVRVRVTRQASARVVVMVKTRDATTVTQSEKRRIPGWDFAGEFSWERRETVRTATYTPVVTGLGGSGSIDAEPIVKVQWYVGGIMLVADKGTHTVQMPGMAQPVHLHYTIDKDTRALKLHNEPADGSFAVPVQASASDEATWREPLTATQTYEVDGLSEGWGADYQAFMDFMDRLNNPIPKRRFGKPRPDDYRLAIDRLRRSYDALQSVNPGVADRMHSVLLDHERVFRGYARFR